MWGKLKAVGEYIYWMVFVGLLVLLHLADSEMFQLSDGLQSMADNFPRLVYPIFYGALVIRLLVRYPVKFKKPKRAVRVLVALFAALFILVKFADLPTIGILNMQYVALFMMLVVGGLAFGTFEDTRAKVDTSGMDSDIDGTIADAPLRKDFSWLWRDNADDRNRELAYKMKLGIWILLAVFIGIFFFVSWQCSDVQASSEMDRVGNAILAVMIWSCVAFALASQNRKSWAPNIDADKKLRQLFGAKYDRQLDKQLETSSLTKLLSEDWFVRMYAELTEGDTGKTEV